MCFPLLPFETFNTLRAYSCFRTNHSYIRIISRETCKQVNVTSSQGNDISIIKSRVHFPSKIDFSIFDVDGTVDVQEFSLENNYPPCPFDTPWTTRRGEGRRRPSISSLLRGRTLQSLAPWNGRSSLSRRIEIRVLSLELDLDAGKAFRERKLSSQRSRPREFGSRVEKLRASFRTGRWPEKRNEETFFQGDRVPASVISNQIAGPDI